MVTQPEILMLDEPAAGPNPKETRAGRADRRAAQPSHTTILLIEHDMKLVMGIPTDLRGKTRHAAGQRYAGRDPQQPDVIRLFR